ncbi:MAG TPA: VTT domain-containing protein, partial [Dehalococcoidia bacterium]|nr:VTT domain-containing protein [Dehalococcoidia bacterium]
MDITRRQAVYLIIAVIVALGLLIAADQLVERVSPWDYEDFERWIDDLGAWGPIIYIVFFALSMVVAPIPTGPAPVAAAAAFGGVLGFFYTLIAGIIGATLCFWIARAWGRPLLRRFLPGKVVDEIDRLTSYLGLRVLFIMRLFPLLGVDAVSYAAGLTPIRFLPYLAVSIVGTIPVLILTSAIGEGIQENRTLALGAVLGLGFFLIAPLTYFALRRRRTEAPLLNLPPPEPSE